VLCRRLLKFRRHLLGFGFGIGYAALGTLAGRHVPMDSSYRSRAPASQCLVGEIS